MARKIHQLKYTTSELDAILDRADNKPFVIWYDESGGVYRFFPDEEKRDAWIEKYLDDELINYPEIEAYEIFKGGIVAPAPNTINITILNDNLPILNGSTGNTLNFTFDTVDGNGQPVYETVDVFYTFRSSAGTKNASTVYSAGTEVHFNIDKYISLGKNSITITVKGKSTGASKTVVATYNVVELTLTSTFSIANVIYPNTAFGVNYIATGDGEKKVYFFVDGAPKANPTVSIYDSGVLKYQSLAGLSPGKHNLQMYAEMQIGDYTFKSELLYYEFIVSGSDLTTTVISEIFPSGTAIFESGTRPGLYAEQYVIKKINWAYYSSDYNMYRATIKWQLSTDGGDNIPIATRNADIISANAGSLPEPLTFMPTEEGTYYLQALIEQEDAFVSMDDSEYQITVIHNTSNIQEATNRMTMKLSGLGRDNAEPISTRTSWTSIIHDGASTIQYDTTFQNVLWNNNSGWVDDALVLNNGAVAQINNKPFSQSADISESGCTFEIDFETFDIDDEDAELVKIGTDGGAQLVITGTKAMLRSSSGTGKLISRFKSDERIKIAFVVYPKSTTIEYGYRMFVYNNGVMSGIDDYDAADNFIMESSQDDTIGFINLGNVTVEDSQHNISNICGLIPEGYTTTGESNGGIKIYSIRTYGSYINMYDELNNYLIDSGENLTYLVADNDIYSAGRTIDVNKLVGTITTVSITGKIGQLLGNSSKDLKITCALDIKSPFTPNINMHCEFAQINKAGQSTLEKPVPSFHVRLDKISGNVCYDVNNKPLPKNRWAFREGNVPEKKFRLQANYMDSSGCHNAAFFKLINEVYPKVEINGVKVLRIPAEAYATDSYPTAMQNTFGDDPTGTDWKFPYKINICPDSIPCIVVWRPTAGDEYRFLGQYVIMEEKKANYANGMHSIYPSRTSKGGPDPFGFNGKKTGDPLWDNSGCHQMEFLRSSAPLELLYDDSTWNVIDPATGKPYRETSFELIYPDDDDLIDKAREEGRPDNYYINKEWDKFYADVVEPICDSYENPSAFNELFYGSNPKLDSWGFAAYYCLVLRNACSDSFVRNMELVTYDGHKWTPKWWDVDMQCGLMQSGILDVQPGSTRDTKVSQDVYALAGREIVNGVLISSWLWDGLTGNEELGIPPNTQFMKDVETMDNALFTAGWTYTNLTKIQDEEYVESWSKALYNETGVAKYINYVGNGENDTLNYISLQGDRTPHRHWFLRTSFDYFDALNVCGEYTSRVLQAKFYGIPEDPNVYIVAAETSYFGWRYTTDKGQTGVKIIKGEEGVLTIDRNVGWEEFTSILGANKIAEIDFSELSRNFYGQINFSNHCVEGFPSQIKKIVMGASIERLNEGEFNTNNGANNIGGMDTLTKLEHFDINGFIKIESINLLAAHNLTKFYAIGTSLLAFNPPSGARLSDVALPTTVSSMTMTGVNLTKNNHCCIDWYRTDYEDENDNTIPTGVTQVTVPPTLKYVEFNNMGEDVGAKELIFDWLNAVDETYGDDPVNGFPALTLKCNNVNWENVSINDVLLLAKIPSVVSQTNPTVTGYIKCSGTITSSDIITIKNAFGDGVFTNSSTVPLRIDADNGFIIGVPDEILAGNQTTITGVVFPISTSVNNVIYRLYKYQNGEFSVVEPARENLEDVYRYKNVVLYGNSGLLLTNETQDDDHVIGIQGQAGTVSSDIISVTIKKRTYPTSVSFDLTHTDNKRVVYDEDSNTWNVSSEDLAIYIDAFPIPEDVSGTVLSSSWTISQEFENIINQIVENNNSIQLNISNLPVTEVDGIVEYSESFVGNYTVSNRINFRLKKPALAVTNTANAHLQYVLHTLGYSEEQYSTVDTELWNITDLNDLGIFDSGSQLTHLAEINSFVDLDTNIMTTLDLSNCSLFGTVHQALLEDGNYYNVDIIPTEDTTLAFEFEEIDLSGTHCKGVNLIQNSGILESISYSDYTTFIELIGQSALTTLKIPTASASTLELIHIENCNNLSGITWN